MISSDRTEAVLEIAQRAWEDHAFPDHVRVEEADGWEYSIPFSGDVLVTRVFYVGGDNPEAESGKCSSLWSSMRRPWS